MRDTEKMLCNVSCAIGGGRVNKKDFVYCFMLSAFFSSLEKLMGPFFFFIVMVPLPLLLYLLRKCFD